MIYCVLIIVVLNFRTQGLFGEKELSLSFVKPWIERVKNAAKVRRMDKQ